VTIAVVGDVHGHLALMYTILARWQREHGRRVDVILQVGDLGVFVAGSTLDSATRKHAARDPEELGFAPFAGPSPPPTPLDPRPPLVFIPGNHEDFDYLDRCEHEAGAQGALCPISADRRILMLRSGHVAEQAAGTVSIRVGGVSGASAASRKRHVHPRRYLNEDDVLALASRGRAAVDILLTHEGPAGLAYGMRHGEGSPLLRLLVEELQPRLAFFGHHGTSGQWTIGRTQVFALADCGYHRSGDWLVARDAVAIVDWADGEGPRHVEYVRDDWLRQATPTSWKHWEREIDELTN
jgi:hypothetical protein